MKSLRSQRQRGQQKKQLMFFHRPIMLSPSPAKASPGSMQPLLQSFPRPMIEVDPVLRPAGGGVKLSCSRTWVVIG